MNKPSYLEMATLVPSLSNRLTGLDRRPGLVGVLREEWHALDRQLSVITRPACRAREELARELFGRLQLLEARVA